jgi:hypothetical protein
VNVPYPDIPDVTFEPVTGWPGYAVSSDGRVWALQEERWEPMEPVQLRTGPESVWLRNRSGHRPFSVQDLVERTQGESLATAWIDPVAG